MASKHVSILKFVGTVSIGLLTVSDSMTFRRLAHPTCCDMLFLEQPPSPALLLRPASPPYLGSGRPSRGLVHQTTACCC
jgi:hypothetical protein